MKVILVLGIIFVSSLIIYFSKDSKDSPLKIYLSNHKVLCKGYGTQMCYTYRDSPDGEIKSYSGEIEGLDFEDGYEYVMLVYKEDVKNPAADAPPYKLVLDKVVSKIPTMVLADADKKFLDNKEFILTELNSANGPVKPDDKKLTLTFYLADSRVSGSDGCNTFLGSVLFNKDKIAVSNIATTRMFCENVTIDKEFYKALNPVDNFKILGNELMLYSGDTLRLKYQIKE